MIKHLALCLLSVHFSSKLLAQDNGYMKEAWGNINHETKQWVQNVSRPNKITKGLQNRHIALWASHGRYFDSKKQTWKWQRPAMFGTTEDLFTQTIVVPYLIPMLEKAGANVFTPRERDWQTNEIIIDNDDAVKTPFYTEYNSGKEWTETFLKGFANRFRNYIDGENPFKAGTSRFVDTTKGKKISSVSYQPNIKQSGKYAVYVSYSTLENSVDDAEYIVYHKGVETRFKVNQQMGGGTWVYLGSFDFDEGCNVYNRVVITNHSHRRGVVSTDAVRFGGGMGNIERGGQLSGLPRAVEGARYYAQWAGAPLSVYSTKDGNDDYADDINARSLMTNWLAGGSAYVPTKEGLKVPLELSLAIHSDAGYAKDFKSILGSLAICTTKFNDGQLNAGISRTTSKDFANLLLTQVVGEMKLLYSNWNKRYLWDRNYSETRLPEIPSAILETMSHQNFPDMKMGQDPHFKFSFARAIYKSVLQYISDQHGLNYMVAPLAPQNFHLELRGKDKVHLSWKPTKDVLDGNANATSYNVYMSCGTAGFDNGTNVKDNSFTMKLEPDVQYNFYVTACNNGGESFPTEVLSVYRASQAKETILVVNGFSRLASPQVVDNALQQGFDMDKDFGISYGATLGWNGKQQCFDKFKAGIEGVGGLGYGGEELAGKVIMGQDFSDVKTHVSAIASSNKYNVVSMCKDAFLADKTDLHKYRAIDLILGLEKDDGYSLVRGKTFSLPMRDKLANFTQHGGSMIVSGAYVGSDMVRDDEQWFLENILKVRYNATDSCADNSSIKGLNLDFSIYTQPNEFHYAAPSTNILHPVNGAICAMTYKDNSSAAVAYKQNQNGLFVMGFPFSCITNESVRNKMMKGVLQYIIP